MPITNVQKQTLWRRPWRVTKAGRMSIEADRQWQARYDLEKKFYARISSIETTNDNKGRWFIAPWQWPNWFILAFAITLTVLFFSGCASECAYRSNGYCYHVEGW